MASASELQLQDEFRKAIAGAPGYTTGLWQVDMNSHESHSHDVMGRRLPGERRPGR